MLEDLINAWHEAVNNRDIVAAQATVTDPVEVSGPRGTDSISAQAFADWIIRSGIRLRPLSAHHVDDITMVIEQEATWPNSTDTEAAATPPTAVATLFRVRDGALSTIRRFDSLEKALCAAGNETDHRTMRTSRGPIAGTGDTGGLAPVTRTVILDQPLAAPQHTHRVEVRRITIAPGHAAGLHVHNGPVFGSIETGSAVYQIEGQPACVLRPGDVFYEPEGVRIKSFDAGDEGVTFLGYFLLDADQEAEIVFPEA